MKYELHPACAVWPLPPENILKEMADDIRANGLHYPITLTTDGQLLSGRCRVAACEMVGIEPQTVVYEGTDYVGFVLSENKHRRHLDPIQLAKVVAQLAKLANGSNQFKTKYREGSSNEKPSTTTAQLVAKTPGVNKTNVDSWKVILNHGTSEDEKAVDEGKAKLRATADIVRARKIASEPHKPTKQSKVKSPSFLYRPEYQGKHRRLSDIDYGTVSRPGQRVQLCPSHIQDLMTDQITVGNALGNITTFVGRFECSMAEFTAALDRLLAYQPVLGKDNGEETDFAAKIRSLLDYAETKLGAHFDWLNKVREAIDKATAQEDVRKEA